MYESTGGSSSWTDQTGWSLGKDFVLANCCGSPAQGYRSPLFGIDCSPDGSGITAIAVPNNGLTGPLLAEIFADLPSLETFVGDLNRFTGTIPDSIGAARNLTTFSVDSASMTGPLPDALCNATSLQLLNLEHNAWTGSIPRCIGQLQQLRYLYLSLSGLTGEIPEGIGQLNLLRSLEIFGAGLSGPLPSSLCNLTALVKLYLHSNNFNGSIPECMGRLTSLSKFDVHLNALSGTIPPSIGNMSSLTFLDFGANNLSGTIPDSIGFLSSLDNLALYGNRLSGSLPGSIAGMSSLQLMDVHSNDISAIPYEFCLLPALQFASLSGNAIDSFPMCNSSNSSNSNSNNHSLLVQLVSLELSRNQIAEPFPYGFFSLLPYLASLDLSYNRLGPRFPASSLFVPGISLRSLSLAYNLYSDVLPLQPCYHSLAVGGFSGAVPPFAMSSSSSSSSSSNLVYLDLSGNNVTSTPVVDASTCLICQTPYLSLSTLALAFTSLPDISVDFTGCGESNPTSYYFRLFPTLRLLDLRGTALVHGLDDVFSLPSLTTLDIQDNPSANASISVTGGNIRRYLQYDKSSLYVFSEAMTCFQAVSVNTHLSVLLDPSFFAYKNCQCRSGWYGKPPHCQLCSDNVHLLNARCSFPKDSDVITGVADPYDAWAESGNIVADGGWYASPPVSLSQQQEDVAYPLIMEVCSGGVGSQCASNGVVFCADGYEGRLCSRCASGYFRLGDHCAACPVGEPFEKYGFLTLILVICALLVAWSFLVGSTESGLVKILVFFAQGLYYIRAPMPRSLYNFSTGASSASLLSISGPECFLAPGVWSFGLSYILSICVPAMTVVVVAVIYVVGLVYLSHAVGVWNGGGNGVAGRAERELWLSRCLRAAVFLLLLGMMGFTVTVIAPLACVRDPGDGLEYMLAVPYERCSTVFTAVSAVLLVVYVVLVPSLVTGYCWRLLARPSRSSSMSVVAGDADKHDGDGSRHRRGAFIFRILYSSYRSKFAFWELIVLVRRLCFILGFLAFRQRSAFSSVVVMLVLVVSLVLQSACRPYRLDRDNLLEAASLGLLMVNLVAATKATELEVSDVDKAGLLTFLLNTILAGFIVILILRSLASKILRSVGSASGVSDRDSAAAAASSSSFLLSSSDSLTGLQQQLLTGNHTRHSGDRGSGCQGQRVVVN